MAGEGETAFKARRSRRWFFSSAAWLVALSLAADIAMAAQNAVTAAYGAVTRESSADDAYIAKSRYLDLMEKAVGAYTPEQIAKYVDETEKKWISEHGFARLTSNLGILVAHGRLPDKKDLFRRMMDICCEQIPKAKSRHGYVTGNDFAVKEIVLCLDEVSRAGVFPKEQVDAWRAGIASIVPATTYSCQPKSGSKTARNWCVFGAASEQARAWGGLGGDTNYVERYVSDQLRFFDQNAMYKDPNQPMVYDFVTRLQFATALDLGYDGPSRAALEALMLKSADITLAMQSATGEIPFGGRSNQFLHNETFYAALCEWYAAWFNRRGDVARARRFRLAARRAVDSLDYWLSRPSVRHVKNRYPLATRYGCEDYGYFNKYMVTMGSWAYLAFRFADESVPAPTKETLAAADAASVFAMSPAFHRTFLNAGGYTAEFDLAADTHYDASGLGRLQYRGAPPMLCLSVPFARKPSYKIDITNATSLAILPGCRVDGEWRYAYSPKYRQKELSAADGRARAVFSVSSTNMPPLRWEFVLSSATGMWMSLTGADELTFTLPVFAFDGEREDTISADKKVIRVSFDGWTCRYTTSGEFVDTGLVYANRNGHYRRFEARGKKRLNVRIVISPSRH